ncbi:MAG: FAD-dependent oxidoreductase [bacterium]|nr:FAD-dependent oxidoreductase [bacterium]
MVDVPIYDLIIVGAGAGGLTASIYSSRYQINHLIFGEEKGGQGILAPIVDNYPGFSSIPGPELMNKFITQAESYGVKVKTEMVKELAGVKSEEGSLVFEAHTESDRYLAKTLILAMGASYRSLGIAGETELIGRGVSYCTNCDAPFFKEKVVMVVGGGDAAIVGAIHVAAFADKVYLVHRRDTFKAEPYRIEEMRQNKKIEQVLSTQIKQIIGTSKVEGVLLDKPYQREATLKVDGVFIEIGQIPATVLAAELGVELDEAGYIKVKPSMETNIPGVFAAGDLSAVPGEIPLRQFITAASDGARAAASVYRFLHNQIAPDPSWGKN